jgi:predicted DNA-binding ribbon-helix-helix protein
MSSSSHVTRTFRLEEEVDAVLREEAEKNDISVNNLVNRIMKEYVVSSRYFNKGESIILSSQTLIELLTNMDINDIMAAAKESGIRRTKDQLLMRGMKLDRKSAIWYITEVIGKYNAWFTCDLHEEKTETMLYLRHNYNEKWSIFLQNYLNTMFKELLDITLDIEYTPNSVILRVPK